jgi:hypothetical protein
VWRKLEYVAAFIALCLWLDWRILRNFGMALLAVLYLPIYLVKYPWNYVTGALLLNAGLALLALLIAAIADLITWARTRKHS